MTAERAAPATPAEDKRVVDLFEALRQSVEDAQTSRSTQPTSLRLPSSLRRAAQLANELGMDESLTQTVTVAVVERVRSFARNTGLVEHFRQFPNDVPRLADVARRRVKGTVHPAVAHPELVDGPAEWVERQHIDWVVTGGVDDAVDRILDYVEMLAAGVGATSEISA